MDSEPQVIAVDASAPEQPKQGYRIPKHRKGSPFSRIIDEPRMGEFLLHAQVMMSLAGGESARGFRQLSPKGHSFMEHMAIKAGYMRSVPTMSERMKRKREAKAAFLKKLKDEPNPSRAIAAGKGHRDPAWD